VIITDEGSQFTSDEFKNYCRQRGIIHNHSLPYHHQANGQVERMVKSFKEVLNSKVLEKNMKWKDAIRATVAAMNNYLPNKSTGYTPHEVSRGYQYQSHIKNIINQKDKGIRNLEVAKSKQKTYYDDNKRNRKFEEGDWVMVINHHKIKVSDPLRVGPFKIIKVLDNDNYLLFNHLRGLFLPYNVSALVPYYYVLVNPKINTNDSVKAKDMGAIIVGGSTIKKSIMASPTKTPKKLITGQSIPTDQNKKEKELEGKRVTVYWDQYDKWYEGTVKNKIEGTGGGYEVLYDDDKSDTYIEDFETLDPGHWKLM